MLITRFLHIMGKHSQIYWRFLFVTSVIMGVQICLTYQIKGEIPVYLNIIALICFILQEIINKNFFKKVKND